jgi:hypothetical protein
LIADIPNRLHEAADATEIGMRMMRHGTPRYGAVFDEVVAQTHVARAQPGMTLAVLVDPQNPTDMVIDWIRTGQLGPP